MSYASRNVSDSRYAALQTGFKCLRDIRPRKHSFEAMDDWTGVRRSTRRWSRGFVSIRYGVGIERESCAHYAANGTSRSQNCASRLRSKRWLDDDRFTPPDGPSFTQRPTVDDQLPTPTPLLTPRSRPTFSVCNVGARARARDSREFTALRRLPARFHRAQVLAGTVLTDRRTWLCMTVSSRVPRAAGRERHRDVDLNAVIAGMRSTRTGDGCSATYSRLRPRPTDPICSTSRHPALGGTGESKSPTTLLATSNLWRSVSAGAGRFGHLVGDAPGRPPTDCVGSWSQIVFATTRRSARHCERPIPPAANFDIAQRGFRPSRPRTFVTVAARPSRMRPIPLRKNQRNSTRCRDDVARSTCETSSSTRSRRHPHGVNLTVGNAVAFNRGGTIAKYSNDFFTLEIPAPARRASCDSVRTIAI